ncbi:hypothetical protein [Desulfofundulus thermosubterraneus]|uniref:Stage III sporulation protein AF n=1 Tax=Desulfofundulus thermosubterraneus DSM 16057 TaxID=1121432 RepID=A0A1M6EFJ1_9FIRM|nr:hypothetical protein [Desulfofundulus thermosubterraneus]SHI84149.1 hypothetical protein SAMN02745219_01179 [Desulfofundulus thermosubterraneus DSM 16057]
MLLNVLLILTGFAVIIAIELPRLLRQKLYRETIAFFVLIAIGITLSLGQALQLPIPNVTKGIEAITRPLFKAIEKILSP